MTLNEKRKLGYCKNWEVIWIVRFFFPLSFPLENVLVKRDLKVRCSASCSLPSHIKDPYLWVFYIFSILLIFLMHSFFLPLLSGFFYFFPPYFSYLQGLWHILSYCILSFSWLLCLPLIISLLLWCGFISAEIRNTPKGLLNSGGKDPGNPMSGLPNIKEPYGSSAQIVYGGPLTWRGDACRLEV